MNAKGLGQASRRSLGKLVMVGVMVTSPLLAAAQCSPPITDPTPHPVVAAGEARPWWRGVSSDLFLSLSYTYNRNDPIPRINQFRVFDFNDDDPQLDVAQLVIQRAIAEPRQFGFRFDLIAGSGVPEVTAAYGLFRDMRTGVAHHADIPQLFLSYIAPVGKGLRFDLGKFATHMGYEVIGGYDGYNDDFSRSFSFGFGVPFTHTGLRAAYSLSPKLAALISVTNGWDDVQRLNHTYTVGTQLALTPTKTTSISFNFIHGPERRADVHDQRSVYEVVGTWKLLPRFAVGVDGLYGHEQNGVAVGHDALWRGLAGYSKYSFNKNFSLAFRGEVFNDAGGTRTGVDQTLLGFTFTPEYVVGAKFSRLNSRFRKADGKFVVRGELRLDLSDREVFLEGSNPIRKQQFTSAVNLIYWF